MLSTVTHTHKKRNDLQALRGVGYVSSKKTINKVRSTYVYGFNGKEKDDEVRGNGNALDFGGRSIYDPRLGKFISIDPKASEFAGSSPYSYAINNPILFIDMNGEAPVKPLGFFTKLWYAFTGDFHVIRAYDFAAAHKIDDSNFFITQTDADYKTDKKIGTRKQVIIYDPVIQKGTNNTIEFKHVFRQNKSGSGMVTFDLASHDDHYQIWDNYWDDQGNPILNQADLSEPIIDAPVPALGTASKAANGLNVLSAGSKTWAVYTFATKSGRYFGLTVDFVRRMKEHGARIVGIPEEMIKLIPDKLTARGIEQLFINWGRKNKVITDQINSISPKNTEKYAKGLKQAQEYLQKNYGDAYNYLFESSK
jgi:RHS repeat-associated protein